MRKFSWFKAKLRYAIWFEAGSKLVADRFRAALRLVGARVLCQTRAHCGHITSQQVAQLPQRNRASP